MSKISRNVGLYRCLMSHFKTISKLIVSLQPADAGFAPSPAPGQPMTGQPSYATTPQQPMTGQPPYQVPPQQPPFSGTGLTGSPPGSNPTYNSAGGGQVGGGNYSQPPIAGSGNTAGVPSGQMPPMPNSMNNVTSNFGKMGIQVLLYSLKKLAP